MSAADFIMLILNCAGALALVWLLSRYRVTREECPHCRGTRLCSEHDAESQW